MLLLFCKHVLIKPDSYTEKNGTGETNTLVRTYNICPLYSFRMLCQHIREEKSQSIINYFIP